MRKKITFEKNSRTTIFTGSKIAKLTFSKSADTSNSPGTLEGYALTWNTLSDDRGGYVVRLAADSATFTDPTLALFHHDYRNILGSSANNTLTLTPDAYGVKAKIVLPDTSMGNDMAELVGNSYINGMSFSLLNDGAEWDETEENGQTVLTYTAFQSDEVTVTAVPAFSATSIHIVNNEIDGAEELSKDIDGELLKLEKYRLVGYGWSE